MPKTKLAKRTGVMTDTWPLGRITTSPRLRGAVPVDPTARRALHAAIRSAGRVDDPVDVAPDGRLVDGYGRVDAAVKAGIKSLPVIVHPEWAGLTDEQLVGESMARNVHTRRNLNHAQWVQLGRTLENLEERLAEERQKAGRKEGGRARAKKGAAKVVAGKVPRKRVSKRALDLVSSRVGMDRRTYVRGRAVLEALEAAAAAERPPLAQLYLDGVLSASLAYLAVVKPGVPLPAQRKAVEKVEKVTDPAERRRAAKKAVRALLPARKAASASRNVTRRLDTFALELDAVVSRSVTDVLKDHEPKKLVGSINAVIERLETLKKRVEPKTE